MILSIDKKMNSFSSMWDDISSFDTKVIRDDLDRIDYLLSTDISSIDEQSFIRILKNFYNVYITKKDILKILSLITGINYDSFIELQSTNVFDDSYSEGMGKNYKWFDVRRRTCFLTAVPSNVSIDTSKKYSFKELNALMNENNLIGIHRYSVKTKDDLNSERFDRLEIPTLDFYSDSPDEINLFQYQVDYIFDSFKSNLGVDFRNLCIGSSDIEVKFYDKLIELIRSRLTPMRLLSDLKPILLTLKTDLEALFELSKEYEFESEFEKIKFQFELNNIESKTKEIVQKHHI